MSIRVLNVSEKPSVAKGISEILSSGKYKVNNGKSKYNKIYNFPYQLDGRNVQMIVTSVSGHVKNLVLSNYENNWNVDPELIFDVPLHKTTPQSSIDIEKTLQAESKRADWLILWLDCDREGENIAFEVIEICTNVNKNLRIQRAHFSAVIPSEVCNAIKNLKLPDKNLSDAVDARQEMDLRIGYTFTRYQTKRWRSKFKLYEEGDQPISFGTCQFPTLGFVVDRYWKRIHFQPEDYWYIKLVLKVKNESVKFNWSRQRLFDYVSCVLLYEAMMGELAVSQHVLITRVDRKQKRKWKPYPLSTVELQKVVSRRFKILTRRVMQIAEKLYQSGLISYPRTETDSFPKGFDFQALIKKQCASDQWGAYAKSLQNGKFCAPRAGKHDDKSHPPIYPTRFQNLQKLESEEERNIFEFIVRHFLACCSDDALGNEVRIEAVIGREKFHCTGLNVTCANFLDVYPYQRWSDKCLPEFNVDDKLLPESVKLMNDRTTAPELLNEADLIQLMNRNGIGTDATMAEHINTIISRKYVTRNSKSELSPTKLGEALIAGYNYAGFRCLNQPHLRAELESSLKRISEGSLSKDAVVRDNIVRYREYYLKLVEKSSILDRAIARYYPSRVDDSRG